MSIFRLALAADHRGYALKEHVKAWLQQQGHVVIDCGTGAATPRVDAMDYALKLVHIIKQERADFAIAICADGQTMAMTANRFPFMRAVPVNHPAAAIFAREHHNANFLALPHEFITVHEAEQIAHAFLTTAPLDDRYAVRRAKLAALDIQHALNTKQE